MNLKQNVELISRTCAIVCIVTSMVASKSEAGTITASDFVNPTLISFDDITSFRTLGPLTPQPYAALGAAFTGSVTQGIDTAPFSGSHLTSGFASGLDRVARVDFSVPVNRVGADFIGVSGNPDFSVRIFDNNLQLIEEFIGQVTTSEYSILSPSFIGLASAQNIARIDFVGDRNSSLTTFPRIDNVRFEGDQVNAIPEPTSLLTWSCLAFAGLAASRRRKERRVIHRRRSR